eukprot:852502-Alexandrium_andersonii.AAC.1
MPTAPPRGGVLPASKSANAGAGEGAWETAAKKGAVEPRPRALAFPAPAGETRKGRGFARPGSQ